MPNKTDFEKWNQSIGTIISSMGSSQALSAMLDGIAGIVPIDSWYVGFYRREAPPIEVEYSNPSENRETYVEGHYLLDPFYNAFIDGIKPGCYSLKELAPPDFKSGKYYNDYYAPWGDSSEVAFILHIDDETSTLVSMARAGRDAKFLTNELRTLNQVSPIVGAVMRCIWERIRPEIQSSDRFNIDFHVRMTQAFRLFATSVLTERESEITHFLLKGHSAKSIARLLDISPGTVRNHMKSIYAKLEISSQSELFGLFYEALSHAGGNITNDPLIYMK